ncbi:713_t:CDS:2 [Diversispora eburnea]|uniref:713_t:CDS:1 n=1 Tax=Diversispora eburnea TaxID=1213867 RepID=A0A9N8VHD1_9GLOM|nr:713_t:CDS:2 [Diversispora eburnea]
MVNKIPIFIPKHYNPFIFPELNAEQKEIYNKLSEYVNTILVSPEDSQYQVEREWVSERCLKRYCRSANWNLVDAKNRIKNSLEWRRVYKPNDIDPKEIEPEAITGKIHINGFDKQGRPVIYLRPGLENTKAGPRQVKNVVFTFEAAIEIMPKDVESVVIIVDFENCSPRTSPGLGIAKEFMHVLGSHYPERLAMALIINAPWYFWGFFKLISPFIDPVTKNKIKFVDLNITNDTTEKKSSQKEHGNTENGNTVTQKSSINCGITDLYCNSI